MPVTIKVNGMANSLVHKFSNGISAATIPDVCKTPSPGGPVPIPYPNIAQSITLADGTTTVKGDKAMAAIKGSKFALSNGDNAGVAGGVKSSTFMKEATWILYSFDVNLNGKGAARLSDKMFHNHENAANLAGEIQIFVSGQDERNLLCSVFCAVKAEAATSKKKPFPYSKRAKQLSGKAPFKAEFKRLNMVTERSALALIPKALLSGRSEYAAKTIFGRMGRKVAAKALGYVGEFLPLINVDSVVFKGVAGKLATGSESMISGAIGADQTVVRIKPDVAVMGSKGEYSKIYDYKFEYKDGGKDSFQRNQKEIYKEATGKTPVTVDSKYCMGCKTEEQRNAESK